VLYLYQTGNAVGLFPPVLTQIHESCIVLRH
jgi:hypothetical protein